MLCVSRCFCITSPHAFSRILSNIPHRHLSARIPQTLLALRKRQQQRHKVDRAINLDLLRLRCAILPSTLLATCS